MTAARTTFPVQIQSPAQPSRAPRALLGAAIHVACVLLTCFITPLVMNSNIWPIAGAFWAALTCPVAAVTGALTGWITRNMGLRVTIPAFILTGLLIAFLAGVIMFNNR